MHSLGEGGEFTAEAGIHFVSRQGSEFLHVRHHMNCSWTIML